MAIVNKVDGEAPPRLSAADRVSQVESRWPFVFELAGPSGCSFPDEVAGVAIRHAFHEGQFGTSELEQLVQSALLRCDACMDFCTVPNPETNHDIGAD